MGLYDDMLEEQQQNVVPQNSINKNIKNSSGGLFDDMLAEPQVQPQPQVQTTFAERHPFAASVPDTFREFGVGAYRSYPEFAKGLNDLVALVGDKTGAKGLSDFGRSNAEFWQNTLDNMPQRGEQYQGVKGLTSKSTFLPTIAGSIGDQATNLLTALGGGAGGAKLAAQVGAKGLAKAGLITAGTSLPNIAQEGSYLDKVQAFQEINGRIPTIEEMKQIQNVALAEKATNTALETVSDKLLFGKLFPSGATTKGVKNFLKNAGQQALTEGGTEGMQEGVSIGAEKLLGINQGDNLSRLADSIAIGGVTGGAFGGASHLASQPYNAQFPENTNATNPINGFKSVSAQILNNGQVFYDNAVDTLNNAAQNFNNMVNTPDTFDTLRTLSKNGDLSNGNTFEQLAPNTAKSTKNKKRKVKPTDKINNSPDVSVKDTNVPNMIDNTNLYNVSENGENTITNQETVENIANEVDNFDVDVENYKNSISEFVNEAKNNKQANNEIIIGNVSKKVLEKAQEKGIDLVGYKHTIDSKAIRHNINNHSDIEKEAKRGQIPLTNDDFKNISDVIYNADDIQYFTRKGLDHINYKKTMPDGTIFYVEEVRNKNKTLTTKTLYKKVGASSENQNRLTKKETSETSTDNNIVTHNVENINNSTSSNNNHTEQPLDMVDSAEKNKKVKKNKLLKTQKGVDDLLESEEYYTRGGYIVKKDSFKVSGKGTSKVVDAEFSKRMKQLYSNFESFNYNSAKVTDNAIILHNATKPIAVVLEYVDKDGNTKTTSLNLSYLDNEFRGYDFSVSDETQGGVPIIKVSDNGKTVGYTQPFNVNISDNNVTCTSLNALREQEQAEKQEKKETSKKPDIRYDDLISIKDKNGNVKYHSDGNALYTNEDVTYTNKTQFSDASPKIEPIEDWVKEAQKFSNKLEETGIKRKIQNKYYAVQFYAGKGKNGEDKFIWLNKKYLLDGKGIELFTKSSDDILDRVTIRRNGKFIGFVMPMQMQHYTKIGTDETYDKKFLSKENVKDKLKKIAPNTFGDKESEGDNGHIEQDSKRRQTVSRKNDETETGIRGTESEQSEVGEVLRGNGQQELRQSELPSRGISQKDKEIIEKQYKNQHELNKAIEDYINNEEYRKYAGSVNMPQEVKDWLKKYAGAGGLEKQGAEGKGLLSEYYTPQNIVNKMWDLTAQYVETNGAKVLEPSVGIGRFLENAPQNTNFDVVEMNPVSARITKILYPDANVTTGEFQEKFINKSNNTPVKSVTPEYDIVIGNPPYGTNNSKFKGMGEGKNHIRLESYFINRGLDSLKENGIMTFIVPSSFLDSPVSTGKQEIGTKCELVDAYRLPENTFDTTSIGTDIIVLRKTQPKGNDKNLSLGKWFEAHPEKILGSVEERKNRFGKQEKFVKGDKNAVENIDTSKKDVKQTVVAKSATTVKSAAKKSNQVVSTNKKVKNNTATVKGKVEYTEYKYENTANEREMELWKNTAVDGSLNGNYEAGQDINQYKGKLYNDFNYLQGDIYEKLDNLERENISEKQKEIQRNKLLSVLPKEKKASEIRFNPTSDFIQDFDIENAEEVNWGRKKSPLVEGFINYVNEIPTVDWRDDFSPNNMKAYLEGTSIDFRIPFKSNTPEYKREKSKKIAKLKDIVEKHFSNYVDKVLEKDTKDRLVKEWNKTFNCIYNPDYTKMPLLVKGLNSKFKGGDLKLKETQIEGINFLANNGVGLIGFEVGVGKTLTGIISTVQNMQMGRCKRPLIIIPKNIKKNWKEEFAETFPNIKVVDVDNMSKWNGEVKDGTITLATYKALDNIWYNKSDDEITDMIYQLGNNFDKETTKRGKESVKERFQTMVGKALKGNKAKFKVEDLGFDHVTFDEAHAGKNLFDEARADSMEKDAGGKTKGTNTYFNMRGGSQSKTALRMFLLTQHILNENNNRNVFMLTATPFNNQSLEVFNMLSYLAKDKLDKMGLYNVYQFNEQFIDVTSDIVLDANNNPVEKQIELGFKNVGALREIIKSCMLVRTADDAKVVRPNKVVTRQKLDPTQEQLYWFDQADELAMDKEIDGALFKSISLRRNATISPDVAANNFDVSPENFIKNSPKLEYIMKCVESMKNKDAKTSQIIYMPIGVKFLGKIKQYLIDKGVYKSEEIEIISSENALSNPEREEERLSKITDSFNDREGDVKLIIGTQKIQVGMNLNKNTSTLYMPYVEWNPTDFVQTVGRMWRQGNTYKNVRVVVPLLKNSSDSFMFQKLDEKIKRMNDLMGSEKEYISNDDLQTEEEKIAMISNPKKRAKMFTLLQKDKIDFEIKKLEARNKKVQKYKSDLSGRENSKKYYEEEIEKLEKLEKENGELSLYQKERLKDYKKSLAYVKKAITSIKAQIELDNIEFDGKDSEEAIENKINEQKAELEKLDKLEEKKIEEYSVEYNEERKNLKSIDEHIAEFEKEYDILYNSQKPLSEDSKVIGSEPTKKYEKTREAAYSVPVINLETARQKKAKSSKEKRIEKAKNIVDARKYNKLLKDGVHKRNSEIGIRRYEADRILNSFINITKAIAKEHKINDKNLREIMPFLRERTGFPESLNRPELKKVWDKVHSINGLAERLTQLADSASEKLERFWVEYKAVQASDENIEDKTDIEHYIYHDWDLDNKTPRPLLTHSFITKSRHEKKRNIPTYYEGIEGIEQENGEVKQFKPKTLDYAELLKESSDNLIKATIDKAFADSVKSFKTVEGANLVLPSSQAPSNWVEINHSALNKTVARPISTKYGEKISPELQNKLAEMGIAIGYRLPKHKGNGQLNSAGKYVRNVPPEIRLQRWFSNKTLAHEIGHAIDDKLELSDSGFVSRHRDELLELNKERIDAFAKAGDKQYAEKDTELIAELFGTLFNDIETAYKIAPAATNEVIEKMTKGKLDSLLPANFDWTEAKHILEEKVVEFFKTPVRVHPDIAATLKTVFEPKKDYLEFLGFKPGKVMDEQTAIMKMMEFSISGFHNIALTESYLGNVGVGGLKEALNFKKIFNSIKNNEYDVYKRNKVAEQAIKDGLQIGTPLDIDRGTVDTLVNNVGNWAENHIKGLGKSLSLVAKTTAKGINLLNKALWDVIHNNYKLNTYELLVQNESKDGVISEAKRKEIASWVNDSFGGQVLEALGINPSTKKALSRWLMSPDWLISTTRQFMGFFATEKGHKKLNQLAEKSEGWQKVKDISQALGITSITDDIEATGMRGRIARAFWIRSAILSALYMNILNALFRMWDKDKYPELYPEKLSPKDYSMLGNSTGAKLYIFIGRNADGTERYLRLGKQFREVPEMVADPIKHFGNKLSPAIQTGVVATTGHSVGGFKDKEMANAKGWKRIGLAGKNLGSKYVPLSIQNAYNKTVKKQGADFTPFDLIGNTSKGMSEYKAKEQFLNAFQKGNTEKIADIEKSMAMNGFTKKDIQKVEKSAKTSYTKQFKDGYVAALQNGDYNKIQQISNEMTKKNISTLDQRKIYTKALSDYYKKLGIKEQ